MFNLLGAAENVGSIIGIAVLIGFLVLYYVLGSKSRKKAQEEAMKMLNELKKGDKIYTSFGVYGEIVSMKETDMGRVVVIKTGDDEGKNVGYMAIDSRAIAGVDMKKDLVLDADGNVIDPEESKELKEEILKENFKAEEKEEVVAQENKQEEKPKKTTKKKTATKTTVTKEENK